MENVERGLVRKAKAWAAAQEELKFQSHEMCKHTQILSFAATVKSLLLHYLNLGADGVTKRDRAWFKQMYMAIVKLPWASMKIQKKKYS